MDKDIKGLELTAVTDENDLRTDLYTRDTDGANEKGCVVFVTPRQESLNDDGGDEEETATLPTQFGYQNAHSNEYIMSPHELYPPDKGWRAWICVVGGFFGTMSTFGFVNVMGEFPVSSI